jgi:hypothetical protein
MGCLGSSEKLFVALVDEQRLGGRLACRGKHDAPVRQVVCADVVTRRRRVIGQLRDGLGERIVLVDLPVRLRHVGVGLVRIERQPQRENDLGSVRRDIEITDVALALGDRRRDVGLGAAGAGLRADVQIAAAGGGDEIGGVDVRGGKRSLDVGDGVRERSGVEGLLAGQARRMAADTAFTGAQCQHRGQTDGDRRQSVTHLSAVEILHQSGSCECCDAGGVNLTTRLNLTGLIRASSFEVCASSVNTLTEDLCHISFPLRDAEKIGGLRRKYSPSSAGHDCRESPTSAE